MTTAETDQVRSWRRTAVALVRRPATWHYLSLALAAVVLVVLARGQWFFFDEWAFLVPKYDGQLFQPHVGHWSTSPILITHALRAIFGLSTYWPYLLLNLAIHLALCHVLWRLMVRGRANAWISTALAFLLMVLGAGAENILWAFQIGFMGAMLLGLIVVLLVDREVLGRARRVAVIVLSIWSLTFSGTAIPVLLAAGLVSLARRGPRKTLFLFAPSAIVYLLWYVIFLRGQVSPYGAGSLTNLGVDLPRYIGHYLIDGIGRVLPFEGLGAIAVILLAIWAISTMRTWRGPDAVTYALAAAALVQAILTAVSRVQLGADSASSSRYIYALVALLLPAVALAATWFARGRKPIVGVLVALVLLTAGYNATLLRLGAAQQSAMETSTQQQLYAALDLISAPGADYDPAARPEPTYAPDVTVADLEQMHQAGWIDVGPYSEGALLSARTTLDVHVEQGSGTTGDCTVAGPGDVTTFRDGGRVSVLATKPSTVLLTLTQDGASGSPRQVQVKAGAITIDSPSDVELLVTVPDDTSKVSVCG